MLGAPVAMLAVPESGTSTVVSPSGTRNESPSTGEVTPTVISAPLGRVPADEPAIAAGATRAATASGAARETGASARPYC